jgi:transcriptional regulator with PAS, ATPase and Fis domain
MNYHWGYKQTNQIIEDKKVHQAGAAKSITIDVRIIASTA